MLQVVLASVVSFLATLSLALSVGSQTDSCPSNGVLDAENFTLLAVDKTNTSYQKPLALTIDGILAPTDAEVPTDAFSFEMLGLRCVHDSERRLHYFEVLFHGRWRDYRVRTERQRCRRLGYIRLRK